MSAPDPESFSLLAKVIAAGTAIAAPIGWLYAKLEKKADKKEVFAELTLHRKYFTDVFEKMETHARRDEDLFREVMGTMSQHHAEILRELGHKADR